MTDNMPVLPNPHYETWLPKVFAYAKWWIEINQVWIMIGVAIALVFAVAAMILNLLPNNDDEQNKDDFDYREY